MGMGSGRCRRCHRWGCNRPLWARVLLASQPVYESTGRIVGYMGQPVQVCPGYVAPPPPGYAGAPPPGYADPPPPGNVAPKRQRAATQQQVQSKQDGKQQPQAKEDSKQQVQPKEQE
jgi:hypothetical protein